MFRLGKLYICYGFVVLCLGNIIVRQSPVLGLNLSVSCAADVVVVLSGQLPYTFSYFPHKNPIEMRCFLRFYLKNKKQCLCLDV